MKDTEPTTPFVLTVKCTDESSFTNAYSTMERATWNLTEEILKPRTVEANITTDGGANVLAIWRKTTPLHAPLRMPADRSALIARAIEIP
jgi:hypothetical protein